MKVLSVSTMCLLLLVAAQAGGQGSPYAGQETRDIKALSVEDVSALLAGQGMGLAKAAELNGYPGPLHVLENTTALKLSDDQKAQTMALFASMQARAKETGKALVEEERRLDRAFGDRTISREALVAALTRIGTLQAELRAIHLEAHLTQRQILTSDQTAAYIKLRGYESAVPHGSGDTGHRH